LRREPGLRGVEEAKMKRAATLRRGRGGGGDGGSRTATRAGRRDRLREWEKQRIHCAIRQMRFGWSGQECRRSVSGACRESAVDRVQARRAHRSALDQLNKVVGRCKMKRFVRSWGALSWGARKSGGCIDTVGQDTGSRMVR